MKPWRPKTEEEKQWAEKLLESAESSIEYKVATYLKKILRKKEEHETNTVQEDCQ